VGFKRSTSLPRQRTDRQQTLTLAVFTSGHVGEAYNIGGGVDQTNKELTGLILAECGAGWGQVEYGPDR
jgi:dTDP-D-glucose 4,6-dehydratase